MNFHEALQFAGANTSIVRSRKNLLYTFGSTRLPYVVVTASPQSEGEVLVRRGEVTAERPKIAIPDQPFQFDGFDLKDGDEDLVQVMLARRIEMPPAKYVNKSDSTTSEKGTIGAAVERAANRLDRENDIRTALIVTPENVWNLAVLLYVGSQVARSAESNVSEHFERLRLGNRP